jgi:hypothetical protein
MHAVALQNPPQSPSAPQLVRHITPAASQWYAPHDVVVLPPHTPAPSQVACVLAIELVQPAGVHSVPAA